MKRRRVRDVAGLVLGGSVLAASGSLARRGVSAVEAEAFHRVNDLPDGGRVSPCYRPLVAALSVFVPFARWYVGAHLPLDTASGSALGTAIGSAVNLALGVPEA